MVAPPCQIEGMKDQNRPKTTTPEEEGIELYPDAWKRFERTFHKVVRGNPVHRTGAGKAKAAANRQKKPRGDAS
jgi:hypothetical protein